MWRGTDRTGRGGVSLNIEGRNTYRINSSHDLLSGRTGDDDVCKIIHRI